MSQATLNEIEETLNNMSDGKRITSYKSTEELPELGFKLVEDIEDALKRPVIAKAEYELNQNEETTEQDKWQRVIDEGYLCRFWDEGKKGLSVIGKLYNITDSGSFETDNGWYDNCEVLREKGIKQPYFQGDDIPEVGEMVIYYNTGGVTWCLDNNDVNWSEVIAYIEV